MFRCWIVAAKPRFVVSLARGAARFDLVLSLCWLAFACACTDPVFSAHDPETADAATPGPSQHTEPADSGGTEPPNFPDCEGLACGEDAGRGVTTGDAAIPDAGPGPEPDAGLDEVRMKWAGRYAARSTLFSYDDPLKNTGKLLSIIAIVPNSTGGLTLEEEMCFYEGGWSFLFTGQLQYVFQGTHGSAALSYGADHFESELLTVHVGYGPTPSACRTGATMQRTDEQVWLTSTCDCPRSEDTPTSLRDCRVTDQESDSKPGATFQASVDTEVIVYHVVQEERVLLRDGYRLGDHLYADRFFEDTTRILDCTINGAVTSAANCPSGAPKNCPANHNKVELTTIPSSYKCSQVTAQEQGLFLSAPPPFPQACPSEVSGSAALTLPAAP
jgi:hypothetical protein